MWISEEAVMTPQNGEQHCSPLPTITRMKLRTLPLTTDVGTHRSWLRHYAISRKVAGSNPDEAIGFFLIHLILLVAL
jgi:hypothetical protein